MKLLCLTVMFLPLYCLVEEDWVDPNDPSPQKQLDSSLAKEQCQIVRIFY